MLFYCDFHSHSRKHNIFIYGCEDKDANEFPLMEQVFPLMMHSASRGKVTEIKPSIHDISRETIESLNLFFFIAV